MKVAPSAEDLVDGDEKVLKRVLSYISHCYGLSISEFNAVVVLYFMCCGFFLRIYLLSHLNADIPSL